MALTKLRFEMKSAGSIKAKKIISVLQRNDLETALKKPLLWTFLSMLLFQFVITVRRAWSWVSFKRGKRLSIKEAESEFVVVDCANMALYIIGLVMYALLRELRMHLRSIWVHACTSMHCRWFSHLHTMKQLEDGDLSKGDIFIDFPNSVPVGPVQGFVEKQGCSQRPCSNKAPCQNNCRAI